MPEPKSYMQDKQKNGEEFDAAEIFEETWKWLKERGCEKLVSAQLIRNLCHVGQPMDSVRTRYF